MQDFLPRSEPGWLGAFSRAQALGALRNGSRVVKTKGEPNDGTPDGTPGIILGSGEITHQELPGGSGLMYWVEWANRPRVAVGVMAWKLRLAND